MNLGLTTSRSPEEQWLLCSLFAGSSGCPGWSKDLESEAPSKQAPPALGQRPPNRRGWWWRDRLRPKLMSRKPFPTFGLVDAISDLIKPQGAVRLVGEHAGHVCKVVEYIDSLKGTLRGLRGLGFFSSAFASRYCFFRMQSIAFRILRQSAADISGVIK